MKRRIAVVTTSRADYGLIRYVAYGIASDPRLRLDLIVSGTHLERAFGRTVGEIDRDGIDTSHRVPLHLSGGDGWATGEAMGRAVVGFSRRFAEVQPEVVLVVGDRFEMLAAAEAAAIGGAAVAHIGGGEVSAGSLDEGWRHAITKIAHLHFTATADAADRVRAMGEPSWRIHIVGAPGLEAVRLETRDDRSALERHLHHQLRPPVAVVTYHPVTNAPGATGDEFAAIAAALRDSALGTVVFTAPNADSGGREVLAAIDRLVADDPRFARSLNLGSRRYLSLLSLADVMVGNSSSGLIEAPAFELPAVNVGIRQLGRLRARNVIDTRGDPRAVAAALRRALSHRFRHSLRGLRNPYGDGRTSSRVVAVLATVPLDAALTMKRFADRRGR